MILAGDIGGTNARLAVFTPDARRMVKEGVFASRDYASFEAIVKLFLGPRPPRIRAASFGIAGPVVGGRVKTTNLPWVLDEKALARRLRIPKVTLLNDLVALGLGAVVAPKRSLVSLQGARLPTGKGATIAVIAAGTGLGECALVWDGARFVPLGTEGGHTDFAPRDALESELLDFLARRHGGHVSYERIVSGPGIGQLYDFFRDAKGLAERPEVAAQLDAAPDRNARIAKLATAGASVPAGRALDLFESIYGAEAGNLALKTLATGGVYVAGGIAASMVDRLAKGRFLPSFLAKGRMGVLLEKIPVAVVLDPMVGLSGAAQHAAVS